MFVITFDIASVCYLGLPMQVEFIPESGGPSPFAANNSILRSSRDIRSLQVPSRPLSSSEPQGIAVPTSYRDVTLR